VTANLLSHTYRTLCTVFVTDCVIIQKVVINISAPFIMKIDNKQTEGLDRKLQQNLQSFVSYL